MLKCKCLWAALLTVTIAAAAGVTYANVTGYFSSESTEQPASIGCCPLSQSQQEATTCPSTSETAPTPCCPLSSGEQN